MLGENIYTGGGCFLEFFKEVSIFAFLGNEGGDMMYYVTWQDLVQIALLVFAIISCLFNRKR
jgi:hypothetical protein